MRLYFKMPVPRLNSRVRVTRQGAGGGASTEHLCTTLRHGSGGRFLLRLDGDVGPFLLSTAFSIYRITKWEELPPAVGTRVSARFEDTDVWTAGRVHAVLPPELLPDGRPEPRILIVLEGRGEAGEIELDSSLMKMFGAVWVYGDGPGAPEIEDKGKAEPQAEMDAGVETAAAVAGTAAATSCTAGTAAATAVTADATAASPDAADATAALRDAADATAALPDAANAAAGTVDAMEGTADATVGTSDATAESADVTPGEAAVAGTQTLRASTGAGPVSRAASSPDGAGAPAIPVADAVAVPTAATAQRPGAVPTPAAEEEVRASQAIFGRRTVSASLAATSVKREAGADVGTGKESKRPRLAAKMESLIAASEDPPDAIDVRSEASEDEEYARERNGAVEVADVIEAVDAVVEAPAHRTTVRAGGAA